MFASVITEDAPIIEIAGNADGPNAVRYLRLLDASGRPRRFVKLGPAVLATTFEQQGALAQALIEHNVRTPAFYGCAPVAGERIAASYKWVDGAHPTAGTADFKRLGEDIARFQNALCTVAIRFDVAVSSAERIEALAAFSKSRRYETLWATAPLQKFAYQARTWFQEATHAMTTAGAPCHGDLNPGNILMDGGKKTSFLDLEDALHSNLWPGFDVVKVAERLVLPRIEARGAAWAESAVASLAAGYGRRKPMEKGPSASTALKWHIGAAVILITKNLKLSNNVVHLELKKFQRLAGQIDQHAHILDQLKN